MLAAAGALLVVGASAADAYPSRPIKLIVAFGPGGSGDLIARVYAQKMSDILGQPIVVENKPGAQQMVAIRLLQGAAPDGYTLYLGTGSSMVQYPALRKDLPYNPKKDFTLISLMGTISGLIFCDPKLPVKNMKEFVAYAKANPGKLNYGSAGIGPMRAIVAPRCAAGSSQNSATRGCRSSAACTIPRCTPRPRPCTRRTSWSPAAAAASMYSATTDGMSRGAKA